MKTKREVRFRHKLIIKMARLLVQPFLKSRYKYKVNYYKDLKNKGPFFVVANHVISVDVMLLGLSFPFNLYYFATENLFNLGLLSKLLIFAANPIKKTKSKADLDSIRKARRIVQQGGSIAVFPEGNLTYTGETNHFSMSIVKLAKLLKLPIVLYKFEGLYLSNPRWSTTNKKGKSKGSITEIIEYEDYKDLPDEELYNILYRGIYTNVYNDKTNQFFTGKNLSKGLERLIFMDLSNNTPFLNYTDDNKLFSRASDYELTYRTDGLVEDKYGKTKTLIEMDLEVKVSYYNYYHNSKEIYYENKAKVFHNKGTKRYKLGYFSIVLCKESIFLKVEENIHFEFKFENTNEIAIQGKNKLIIYYLNDTYLLIFGEDVSMYAFLLTYQIYSKGAKQNDDKIDFTSFGLL